MAVEGELAGLRLRPTKMSLLARRQVQFARRGWWWQWAKHAEDTILQRLLGGSFSLHAEAGSRQDMQSALSKRDRGSVRELADIKHAV